MTVIDPARVSALFQLGDTAETMTARGRALEDLIAYVFGLIPVSM